MGNTHERRSYSINPDSTDFLTWPKISPGSDTPGVPYCYNDQTSLDRLETYVNEALDRWEAALGPKAGIFFEEVGVEDDIIFCEKDGEWNPDTQREGLVVFKYVKGNPGSYKAEAGYNDDKSDTWRHTLSFDPDEYLAVDDDDRDVDSAMAHELGKSALLSDLSVLILSSPGHIMGLAHEHQRPDAHNNIIFTCENLQDYDRAVEWFAKKDRGFTIQQACSDLEFADQVFELSADGKTVVWKFLANQFVRRKDDDEDFVASEDFDMSSIMIYGSEAAAKDSEQQIYPLKQKNGQRIKGSREITAADVAAVNKMYPPKK